MDSQKNRRPTLPFRFQASCYEPSPGPVLILPAVVRDGNVDMVEEVESVLLVEVGLKNIKGSLNASGNRTFFKKKKQTLGTNRDNGAVF